MTITTQVIQQKCSICANNKSLLIDYTDYSIKILIINTKIEAQSTLEAFFYKYGLHIKFNIKYTVKIRETTEQAIFQSYYQYKMKKIAIKVLQQIRMNSQKNRLGLQSRQKQPNLYLVVQYSKIFLRLQSYFKAIRGTINIINIYGIIQIQENNLYGESAQFNNRLTDIYEFSPIFRQDIESDNIVMRSGQNQTNTIVKVAQLW
ncbi:hypothetical protein ABPG74_017398 [Tetrahymena malaccensis]